MNIKTKWDLSPLFKSDTDPKIERVKKETEKHVLAFANKWRTRNDYLKNPKILKTALDEYERLMRTYSTDGGVSFYFWLRRSKNQNNPNIKAHYQKIEEMGTRLANEIQFFELSLAKIKVKEQKKFLSYTPLNNYHHWLERLFAESKFLLTEPEEKILNLKASVSHERWVHMLESLLTKEKRSVLDEKGITHTKTFSEISSLTSAQNKKVRDNATEAFNDILKTHRDVAEAEINAILANKKINDDLRKMNRPDLARHMKDDIESSVIDVLTDTVERRFKLSQDYYRLKAKILGVKKLEYQDRNVDVVSKEKKILFTESMKIAGSVFQKLEPEFNTIFQKFIKEGRIDVFPKEGKQDGGYFAYHLTSQKTFILLNYTNRLRDVTTLAHEMGHAINRELTVKKENSLNANQCLATSEVASTFMEDFVLEEITKNANDELKLGILMAKLNDDISSIQRQVAAYRFEYNLHAEWRKKGHLSHQEIGHLFLRHMSSYLGPYVKLSPGSENWWIYWSHFRNFFYIYSYASGTLISKSLQNSVRKEPTFIKKVKKFLSTGTSDSPKNIFLKLGIDITKPAFWNQGLDEIEKNLTQAETLAKKLKKI